MNGDPLVCCGSVRAAEPFTEENQPFSGRWSQAPPLGKKAFPAFKRTQEKKKKEDTGEPGPRGSRACPGTEPNRAGSSLPGQRGCSRAESGPDPVPLGSPRGSLLLSWPDACVVLARLLAGSMQGMCHLD